MTPNFHYRISGQMLRTRRNRTNPVVINKEFFDHHPIVARQKAFDAFHSYIDVFLSYYDIPYTSFEGAIESLKQHLSLGKDEYARVGEWIIDKIDADFDLGIDLYLVTNNNRYYVTLEGGKIFEEEILLHRFSADFKDFTNVLFDNLSTEFLWYKENGFDFGDNQDIYEALDISILKSPVNFDEHILQWIIEVI